MSTSRLAFALLVLLATSLGTEEIMAQSAGEQSNVVAINVLIEPGSALADPARAVNARMLRDTPDGFALDATHVPHITLLQRYVQRQMLDKVTAAVAKIVARPEFSHSRLRATGYEASEATPPQKSVVLNVERTPKLQQLQRELEQAVAPYTVPAGDADAFVRSPGPPQIEQFTIDYVREFVPKRMGENYSPHVTLGVSSAQFAAALQAEKFTPYEFEIARFAVYQVGDKGTARKRLWP
jgi:2'-5' RNA ligase